jgi:hypothetical protein
MKGDTTNQSEKKGMDIHDYAAKYAEMSVPRSPAFAKLSPQLAKFDEYLTKMKTVMKWMCDELGRGDATPETLALLRKMGEETMLIANTP